MLLQSVLREIFSEPPLGGLRHTIEHSDVIAECQMNLLRIVNGTVEPHARSQPAASELGGVENKSPRHDIEAGRGEAQGQGRRRRDELSRDGGHLKDRLDGWCSASRGL